MGVWVSVTQLDLNPTMNLVQNEGSYLDPLSLVLQVNGYLKVHWYSYQQAKNHLKESNHIWLYCLQIANEQQIVRWVAKH